MAATFSVVDLHELAGCVADAWRLGAAQDWGVPAGTLEWSCARTADHAVDTLLAPAIFLASQRTDRHPAGGWSLGDSPSPEDHIEGVEIGARVLSDVVVTTPAEARALLFQHYGTVAPPADFLPRGALELVLHAHDVCAGLGVDLDPPRSACDNLRAHVSDWPFWGSHWPHLKMTGDPWADLLRTTGRIT